MQLQLDKVKRQIYVVNGKLLVHFEAVEARVLRASFSAFGLVDVFKIWRLLNALAVLDGIKMAVDSGLHPPLTVESDYFNAVKSILKKRLRMDDQR
ncbi:hypothetical protein WN943_014863 [Citrus x changshan-huyou]